jgi:shikimate dehydrogenase
MTAKAAVIGWPVEHSLSPVLHGYWLKKYGIDGTYEKIAVPPEKDFAAEVARLRDGGCRGVNVTVPYKEAAFALADAPDDSTRQTGAANLLIFKNGHIHARNTDGVGLADSLMQALGNIWPGGKSVVLLGAGGAARGAIWALHQQGVARITVLNRHKARAIQLVERRWSGAPDVKLRAGSLEDWESVAATADLVINTTSAGMKGNPPLAIDVGALPPGAAVCDIVYNPLETPLLAAARARNLEAIDGLGMLMYQAAPSFQAFFYKEMGGRMPEVTDELRTVLEKELANRG